ncbi:hypothetical protein NP493_575g01000 [Ridgeia piscesae]|uniref:Uncharacterized protein n=1 Tax=Ridgeia piscesae TaxID=27915 RepID=A0AAD9KUT4_RIDPI|nr:hypothetical protein NP493_575g01000 [Ridgeia piscesae]
MNSERTHEHIYKQTNTNTYTHLTQICNHRNTLTYRQIQTHRLPHMYV